MCLATLAAGCNKGPARTAIAESEQALAAARPDLERYAPKELAAIASDLGAARGRLAAGQYTDALRIAQRLPERIALATAQAESRKREQLEAAASLEAHPAATPTPTPTPTPAPRPVAPSPVPPKAGRVPPDSTLPAGGVSSAVPASKAPPSTAPAPPSTDE